MTTPQRPADNPNEPSRDYDGMALLPVEVVAAIIERRRTEGIDSSFRRIPITAASVTDTSMRGEASTE